MNHQKEYSDIEILEDETNGLVELSLISRHNQDRASKIKNNFTGQLESVNPKKVQSILELLNKKLPEKEESEVVVGLMVSGVVLSSYLAHIRESCFTYTVHNQFGDLDAVFQFKEERNDKVHYMYGIEPGDNVIIVEDEVTSGGSAIELFEALKGFGVETRAICCVTENCSFGAREKIKEKTGLDLQSLIRIKTS